MKEQTFEAKIGTTPVSFTIDEWAENANGSVRVQMGDTVVLVTAVMSRGDNENLSFFPLTVDYEERYYAAGKILGSRYMRREGRPSEEAIITARLIDRAIRPLFPKHLKREVQVIVTTLSWDGVNDPDIAGLLGASLALSLSDIPWKGPLGGVRVGKTESGYVLNPTYWERETSILDFVLAGEQEEGKVLFNMVEAESEEVSEGTYEEALKLAAPAIAQLVKVQEDIVQKHGREKAQIAGPVSDPGLQEDIRSFLGDKLKAALFTGDKLERMERVNDLKAELSFHIEGKYPGEGKEWYAKDFFEEEINRVVHEAAIREGRRVDDRKLDEVRDLEAHAGMIPRTHGSGLFRRGQTRTLSLLTLGGPGDHKLLEGMEVRGKKRFMHHYNFPPYAPGEVKRLGSPGRREIGHGMLAEKALLPVIPDTDQFPYTIRIVTEVVSSNGSTSMASACSSSLALMDAGVPITRPVAGISVGLMSDEQGNYKLLTDIQGPEDHHGDMDFKIAGTSEGITAIQLDVKIQGITEEIFKETLKLAKDARAHILKNAIAQELAEPRKELSPFAPKVSVIRINPEKIGMVIGPGGKVINKIIADHGVSIDIEDETGEVFISSEDAEAVRSAVERVKNIVREVEVGELFEGTVRRITDFGAFVEVLPGQDGLVHISELAPYRVNKVSDIVKEGDRIPVKVIGVDEQGKIRLSLKEARDAQSSK